MSPPEPAAAMPLRDWRFRGALRASQADILGRLSVDVPDRTLHIVAPPGSGKTLLGLLLAMRAGCRAVVFAPTAGIRGQWAATARTLAPEPGGAGVSEDPLVVGDFTALSYQALSVLDGRAPLAPLAHDRWLRELVDEGRSHEAAAAWLGQLRVTSPDAYRRGLARRSRTVRRQLVREEPDALLATLHPNARALIERLVEAGVGTIILDECHHLLDHWALVVAALVARLRAAGRNPMVIGLTATLPSPDDAEEYENYTSLLGEVDDEIPVPAVVREGNLAPYRDLVRFAEPSTAELAFLRAHADGLQVLIRTTFARGDGLDYLVDALQPGGADAYSSGALEPETEDTLRPPGVHRPGTSLTPPPASVDRESRLAAAFAADFAAAAAASAMLATVAPEHPLARALPADAHRPPSADEAIRLLGRWALDRVLPDPQRRQQWERIRRSLADFGYGLTDRGVRRARDPIDTMLAGSIAKDHAAADILAREHDSLGDRLRALVVTDYTVHGNTHGGAVSGAGALRTFDELVADPGLRLLPAILVTGSTVRVAADGGAELVDALSTELSAELTLAEAEPGRPSRAVRAPGVGSGRLIRAVSALMSEGRIRLVVGTRGLFGEGWDCPAVNTLIDLTAVATASATQQLRGRTLRLDPAWPGKVAHNWTVTSLLPPGFPIDAAPDMTRLVRKHARLWGLDRDRPGEITRGLPIALPRRERDQARAGGDAATLNAALDEVIPARADTAEQWRVGTPFVDREEVAVQVPRSRHSAVFRAARRVTDTAIAGLGAAAASVAAGVATWAAAPVPVGPVAGGLLLAAGAAGTIPLLPALRLSLRERRITAYADIAAVVWEALRVAGRVADLADPGIRLDTRATGTAETVTVQAQHATIADQRTLSTCLAELFAPVRTPRFLLEVGAGGGAVVSRLLALSQRWSRHPRTLLSVPAEIARRREDAVRFSRDWNARIGPATLHELSHPGKLALALEARSSAPAEAPAITERWV